MNQKKREIQSLEEIKNIISQLKVCRLAFSSADFSFPYIVPMNFGCDWEDDKLTLYFHCAPKGKKLEMMAANPKVCFEMDTGHALTFKDKSVACTYSYRFESVIGYGIAKILTDEYEKRHALSKLMEQHTGQSNFNFPHLNDVTVFAVNIESFTGKRHL